MLSTAFCAVFTRHGNIAAVLGHFLYFQVDLAVWHIPGKQNKTKSSLVFLTQNYQNKKKKANKGYWKWGAVRNMIFTKARNKTNLDNFQSVRINQDAFVRHAWAWLCCDSVHEPPSCVTLQQNPVFATLLCAIPKHQVLDVPSAAPQYTPASMIADTRASMHDEHSISIFITVWGCIVGCVHWSR